jgi:hypothetical protein
VNATDLIAQCEEAGILLMPHGDKLRVYAPDGLLTPELRHRLLAHKPEILAELRAWDAEADAVLDSMYRRVAAAFEVRSWPIPGPGDDAHQAAIEEACRRRDIQALKAAAWQYICAAEKWAALFAETVHSATKGRHRGR